LQDRLIGLFVAVFRIDRIGRIDETRRAPHHLQFAIVDVALGDPHREIARAARGEQVAYPQRAEVQGEAGMPQIGEGKGMIGLEFRPPVHEDIVEHRPAAAAVAGGHQHQLFVEKMLDDEPRTACRTVHHGKVQRAFQKLVHQPAGGAGRGGHGDIGNIFAHPR
jgi:hypothetical protein